MKEVFQGYSLLCVQFSVFVILSPLFWPVLQFVTQTCGEKACHPEGNEGSGEAGGEILRFPQDDRRDLLPARSQVA